MNYSEFFSKQCSITVHIFNFAHLTCNVLQPRKFDCHCSKFQGENLYDLYNLVVAEGNIDRGYKLNLFSQV